jgi:hypothetical protein
MLEEFEDNLFDRLQEHLRTSDPVTHDGIRRVVGQSFDDISETFKFSKILSTLLIVSKKFIELSTWIAINVPLISYPEYHVICVVDNVRQMFRNEFYMKIQNEIDELERAAECIQRAWLACYYTPSHPVCRRRLHRQFTEIHGMVHSLRAS